ncbi:MAG: beta-glucuronidase, partial [Bacteroidales bacterium]|nr:beta-glucuronidase [Bacteroidales bacterium]
MKRITYLAFSCLLVLGVSCARQADPVPPADDGCFGLSAQIQNVGSREKVSLDGNWKAFIDQYETGYYDYRRNPMPDAETFFADRSFHADRTKLVEYDFDTASELRVPGDWNTQRPELYLYEGTVWYRQKFQASPRPGTRTFLYFGAANYEAVVGLNGHPVAKHLGGYTPFNIEITDQVRSGENAVIVKVDNKRMFEGVPTVNSDWWNYGGITRDVYLVTVPETFIREYSVQLSKDRSSI